MIYTQSWRHLDPGKCDRHGSYHRCTCGMSHGCGTANAQHILGHDGIGFQGHRFLPAVERARQQKYNPWEGPQNECPYCYHERQKEKKT